MRGWTLHPSDDAMVFNRVAAQQILTTRKAALEARAAAGKGSGMSDDPKSNVIALDERRGAAVVAAEATTHEPCAHCGGEVGPCRPGYEGSVGSALCCYRCLSHWPEMRHMVPHDKLEPCGRTVQSGRCEFCEAKAPGPKPRSAELLAAIAQLEAMRKRPTIEDVLPHFKRYYVRHEETWGPLGAILGDGGATDDDSVSAVVCVLEAAGDDQAEILARTLAKMSESARRKLPGRVRQACLRIVRPDGTKALEAPGEVEEIPSLPLSFFVELAKKWWPTATPGTISQKANELYDRQPVMNAAYLAGLCNARDLKERTKYGKGLWWAELEPLTPKERTFVLDAVKKQIGVVH
jgi:hypothetical protein